MKIDLPHSPEIERQILGDMIRFPEARLTAMRLLKKEHFHEERNQKLFEAIQYLHELHGDGNGDVDLLSLQEHLKQQGKLDEIGGEYYLMELADKAVTSVNTKRHCGILIDQWKRRRLIRCIHQIDKDAPTEDLQKLFGSIFQEITTLNAVDSSGGLRHVGEFLDSYLDQFQECMQRKRDGRPFKDIQTGIADLDRLTGGMNAGELWTLGARPSEGKSLLGAQVAMHVAQSGPVAFSSHEMSGKEILARAFSTCQGYDDKELAKSILEKADALSRLNLFIDDRGGLQITDIATRCEWLKREKGALALIVIDYLQLIRPPDFLLNKSPTAQVTYISNNVKTLARRLECPILLLSQLNRSCENENRPPRLSDLRESGSIEQDSDLVMFIHRPKEIERGEDGIREILVEKNRNGPTGKFELVFNRENLAFYGLSNQEAEAIPF